MSNNDPQTGRGQANNQDDDQFDQSEEHTPQRLLQAEIEEEEEMEADPNH